MFQGNVSRRLCVPREPLEALKTGIYQRIRHDETSATAVARLSDAPRRVQVMERLSLINVYFP